MTKIVDAHALQPCVEANGGAIRSAASGTGAALVHAGIGHDSAHKVDWRRAPPEEEETLSVAGVAVSAIRYPLLVVGQTGVGWMLSSRIVWDTIRK